MTRRHALSLGMKWTKLDPSDREKHFEVIELERDHVVLRCIVTTNKTRVARLTLPTSELWRQGWH